AISIALLDNVTFYFANYDGTKFSEEENDLVKRFGATFQQAYTRFLDLQKAEAQAKEAQIELALERVRARTMAMQNSDELPEAANLLFHEIQALGIPAFSTGYCIWEGDKTSASCNMGTEGLLQKTFILPTIGEGYNFYDPFQRGEIFYVSELNGEELIKHYKFMRTLPVFGEIIDGIINAGISLPTFQIFHIVYFSKGYLMFITHEPVPDAHDIFKRFTSVFEQTYTRFLDLQKAEAQAKEAQIEVVLERVRARALAMHSSEELEEVSIVLRSQMAAIGEDQLETVAIHFIPDGTEQFTSWFAFRPPNSEEQEVKNGTVEFSKSDTHYAREFIRLYDADDQNYLIEACGNHLKEWQKMLVELSPVFKELWVGEIPDHQYWYFSDFSGGNLMLITLEEASEEALELLRRSAQVFDLAYRRYLDLQKAENQAREAQIETALERVRSRTLAMHKSSELSEAGGIIFKQLGELGIKAETSFISLIDADNDILEIWTAHGSVLADPVKVKASDHPNHKTEIETWKTGQELIQIPMPKKDFINLVKDKFSIHIEDRKNQSIFYLTQIRHQFGFIGMGTWQKLTFSELDILTRFTKVFEQTYTRFLDLQKAEEQAREAQIEASLERVRSKTMAMHNSKDVELAVLTLFDEVLRLGLDKSIRCGIGILEGNEGMETWSATSNSKGDVDLKMGMLDMEIHPLLTELKKAWNEGEAGHTYELIGKDVTRYYKALNDDPGYPFNANLDTLPEKVFHNSFFFSEGILFAFTSNPISEEAAMVLKRFTSVFEQTYTRFLDLKKAEAQTKEAQIEASLERVRSKAMAMHNSEDLVITANQLFKEFQYLNISFIRCGVLRIYESKKAEVYSYSLTKENETTAIYGDLKLIGHEMLDEVFKHWQLQKEYRGEMKGDAVKRYYQLLNKQVNIPKIELGKSHFVYGFYFPEGCLYCFTNEKLTDETLRILRKFNSVMGLTYRRYFELQEAEVRELAAIKESSLDRVRAQIASMRTANDLNRITPLVWKELTTLGVPFFRCGVFIVDNQSERVHAYLSSPSGESIAALELEFDSMPLVKGVVSHWKKQKVYVEKWNKAQFIE
ncbi:MAG: hypothetical protein J7M01_02780, partial [Candidatus Marinimicrobia bacterium]|nr:hypothetical protein [Candidatus Neomarinimicrobiota bacterium]